MKRMICMLLLGAALMTNPATAHAAELNEEEYFEIVDHKPTLGMEREASWGYGNLYVDTYLFNEPSAYATTQTYSGNAYSISVQVSCIDNDGNNSASQKISLSNTNFIQSATIKSLTKKCEFFGFHSIQSTSNSGVQTCDTYKKID